MRNALQTIARQTKRLTVAALAATAMLGAGCANAGVTGIDQMGLMQAVHADVIYVHAFDADAGQVKLDGGLVQKVRMMATGSSSASAQGQTAAEAREQVASEIVRELRGMGLNTVRSDAPAPAGANALVVEGDFRKIDEGSGRRRLLIGLGAGKSEVGADVRISYQPANGTLVPLQSFVASADSGHIPGVAETAGIGAAAGHVAMAAAGGAGVHGATEMTRDSISADATRLGNAIASQVAAASTEEGWLTASAAR
ncbi:DUF4410 domain-containing protein [Cupriavidus oxalaticus]|uniref:DUF4410 domain-containing protein n=1 Tax=Cupriavidus oxalaticus TaxID=96344 RepID=A0A5P3VBR6_9BURK|nr:DUF4410 domain-containing protein [Cupriavidus oxalaticus]QEZ43814.1 DUF4410 domain-containing protein [Cupriavidus oxalaticus]